MQNLYSQISHAIIVFLPFLLGIILHEIAHGLIALKCGDPTARMMGRLTMNPIKHIDPVGIGCFIVTALFTPFVFGWAKPVPINPRFFRNYRRDMFFVSFAGPACNLLLAVIFGVCLRLFLFFPEHFILNSSVGNFLFQMFLSGISANLVLCWFNLIPIPPLDGGHILECILPNSLAMRFSHIGKMGFMLIALLLMLGTFNYVLLPIVQFSHNIILKLTGIL